jgi:serine/threonine protein kinase
LLPDQDRGSRSVISTILQRLPTSHIISGQSGRYQLDLDPLDASGSKDWLLFRGKTLNHSNSEVVVKIGLNVRYVRQTFIREIKQTALYRLSECERLVTAIDYQFKSTASLIFLVFPYRGTEASDFISDNWENEVIADILSDVFEGMLFLCQRGLLHRDIKLENICILEKRAFLIDLELIRPIGSKFWGIQGTVGYLSRELLNQFSEHIVKEGNDVFAVAIVVLQMFAGICLDWDPYFGFAYPEDLLSKIPKQLRDCFSRALDDHSENRPTLMELGEELNRFRLNGVFQVK